MPHVLDPTSVFINAPFDDSYEPLFEALVFAITACGYRARCALEVDDSGDIRLEKLIRLIAESPRSLHDLSRTTVADGELPRFNMPFELGLAFGAKRFHPDRTANAIKVMVKVPYKLPTYLSDLAGNDCAAHLDEPTAVIQIVVDFLHVSPDGDLLEGPKRYAQAYADFRSKLPAIAAGIQFEPNEVRGLSRYRIYLWCVFEYLRLSGSPNAPARGYRRKKA